MLRRERDKTSQENRSRIAVMKTMVTELVNGVIDSGRFVGPNKRPEKRPLSVTLFASVGAEATMGLAANCHLMAVGKSGGKSPFAASPRATRPTQCEVVEEAVAGCVSKPRRGEKDAGGSSHAFRGWVG